MRSLSAAVLLLLASCATTPGQVGMPFDEMRTDSGTLAGSWQEVRRSGKPVNRGVVVSISSFSTFAAERGCVATGGVLRELGTNRFRIERYSNMAKEGCGPWTSAPELGPFHGDELTLVRVRDMLIAEGSGERLEFRRMTLRGPGV